MSKVKVTRSLLTAALTHEADVAVAVKTYWAWETTATLRLLGGARRAGAPTTGGEGRGISCRHAHSLLGSASVIVRLDYCNVTILIVYCLTYIVMSCGI